MADYKNLDISLVVSDDATPRIKAVAGTRIEAQTVSLIDPVTGDPAKIAARLCGGTNTCLALMKT